VRPGAQGPPPGGGVPPAGQGGGRAGRLPSPHLGRWHHHQALSLIAVWFLTREARGGKKADPGPDGPAGPAGQRSGAAPGGRVRPPGSGPADDGAVAAAERGGEVLPLEAAEPLAPTTAWAGGGWEPVEEVDRSCPGPPAMRPSEMNPAGPGSSAEPDPTAPAAMMAGAPRPTPEKPRWAADKARGLPGDTRSAQLPIPLHLHVSHPSLVDGLALRRRLVADTGHILAEIQEILFHTREAISRSQALLARSLPDLWIPEPSERAG